MTKNSLNKDQIRTMLKLQSELNSIVDKDWIAKKFPFLRAAFVESAEALDHLGWKWWKKQTSNLTQVQIEISDILHFYLSDLLLSQNGDIQNSTDVFVQECQKPIESTSLGNKTFNLSEMDTQSLIELLGAFSVLRERSLPIFQNIMTRCDLDWGLLYLQYTSKNVLNIFRQNNGYKEGTYIKIWNTQEDNEYLAVILEKLDTQSADFAKNLYFELSEKYNSIIKPG